MLFRSEELSALGHEIIGADISESRVDSIKDKVATAFVIDATDEQSLSVLPLNSVDIVVVAIGENFGASVRVVALLKQKKVPRIFARAIDAVHKAVLEAFSLEKILTPEEDAARSLGGSVFSGCSALTKAVVPAGITEIGEYLFWGCTSLEKVQLPEDRKSVV